MADDPELYELAKRFPEAVLALLGIHTDARYRGEAIEVKAASGRFDAVLTPDAPPPRDEETPALTLVPADPAAPRIFVEFQNRHDADAELRWALKVVTLVAHTPPAERGPVRLYAIYGEERFLEAAKGGADLGDRDQPLLAFTPVRRVLSEIDPAPLEAAGWAGRLVLPLVGDEAHVATNAGRWAQELRDEPTLTQGERDKALDLFTRFLLGRLGEVNMKVMIGAEKIDVAKTATGRALIAEGQALGEARGAIAMRQTILDTLDARGIAVPTDVAARLEQTTDLERLRRIHRAALTVGPDLAGLFAD